MTFFQKLENFIARVASAIAIIGGMGLIFATLITCISILLKLLRRSLDFTLGSYFESTPWSFVRPILGEEELVAYGVGFALFAALPWVMLQKGHIKVDLFEKYFSQRFNLFLNFLGDLLLAIIAYLILTRQWFLIFKKARRSQESMLTEFLSGNFNVLSDRLRDSQESQILGLPLWQTYIVAEIFILLFLITAIFCTIRSARSLWLGAKA